MVLDTSVFGRHRHTNQPYDARRICSDHYNCYSMTLLIWYIRTECLVENIMNVHTIGQVKSDAGSLQTAYLHGKFVYRRLGLP